MVWLVYREGEARPIGRLDGPHLGPERALQLASIVYGIPVEQLSVRPRTTRSRKPR